MLRSSLQGTATMFFRLRGVAIRSFTIQTLDGCRAVAFKWVNFAACLTHLGYDISDVYCFADLDDARLRSTPAQGSSRRRSDFRCADIRSAVVRRAKCSQQRS